MEKILILCFLLPAFFGLVNAASFRTPGDIRKKISDLMHNVESIHNGITSAIQNIDEIIEKESLNVGKEIDTILIDMKNGNFNDGKMESDSEAIYNKCLEYAYLRVLDIRNGTLKNLKKCFGNSYSSAMESHSSSYEARTQILSILEKIREQCTNYDKSAFLFMPTHCIQKLLPFGATFVDNYRNIANHMKENLESLMGDELDDCFDKSLYAIESSLRAIEFENDHCLEDDIEI